MASQRAARSVYTGTKTITAGTIDTIEFAWGGKGRIIEGFRVRGSAAGLLVTLVDKAGSIIIGDAAIPPELLSPDALPRFALFPGGEIRQRAAEGLVFEFTNPTGGDLVASIAVWTKEAKD